MSSVLLTLDVIFDNNLEAKEIIFAIEMSIERDHEETKSIDAVKYRKTKKFLVFLIDNFNQKLIRSI